jgi:hypothetical protein
MYKKKKGKGYSIKQRAGVLQEGGERMVWSSNGGHLKSWRLRQYLLIMWGQPCFAKGHFNMLRM